MTDLCLSCCHCKVLKYLNKVTKFCDELSYSNNRVDTPVTECTSYHNKKWPEYYELKQIAWTLDNEKKKGVAGFQPPKKENEFE